jgi:hypothetical protein
MRKRILTVMALLGLACTSSLTGVGSHEARPGMKKAKFAVT